MFQISRFCCELLELHSSCRFQIFRDHFSSFYSLCFSSWKPFGWRVLKLVLSYWVVVSWWKPAQAASLNKRILLSATCGPGCGRLDHLVIDLFLSLPLWLTSIHSIIGNQDQAITRWLHSTEFLWNWTFFWYWLPRIKRFHSNRLVRNDHNHVMYHTYSMFHWTTRNFQNRLGK